MKLRINKNSIRLRLTPDEVGLLSKNKSVKCSCQLPHGILHYELIPDENWDVSTKNSNFSVFIPFGEIESWDNSEQVGFEHRFESGLLLLVEKDFQCLKPRKHEEESHLYPNPDQV